MHIKQKMIPSSPILLFGIVILTLGMIVSFTLFSFAQHPPRPPMKVYVTKLQKKSIVIFEDLAGRVHASKISEVRPQATGIIIKRLFKEGSFVKKGQQLYQIDPARYQAAYNSSAAGLTKAQAAVKNIQAKADRYTELVKINAISYQDYDDIFASLTQAKASIAVAEAALDMDRINLNYTKVFAPISGRIGKSTVTSGALVTAQQAAPLATITQLDPIYVDLNRMTKGLSNLKKYLKKGQKLKVVLFDDEGHLKTGSVGTLEFSDVRVNEVTGMVQLRALFPNANDELLPGLFVRARLNIGAIDGFLIPQDATVRRPDGQLQVAVVKADNTIDFQVIKVGRSYRNEWLVIDGVKEGQMIALSGFHSIRQGAKIVPVLMNKKSGK